MIVTVTRTADSVRVSSSEPLDPGILSAVAGHRLVAARMAKASPGAPVRFKAAFVRSKSVNGVDVDEHPHTFEIGDEVP
jgi:hypothetical protein